MHIQPGFMLREVAGHHMVVPLGEQAVKFNEMFTLSETGSFIWGKLAEEQTQSSLVDALLAEYSVEHATAEADVAEFLEVLRAKGLLVE